MDDGLALQALIQAAPGIRNGNVSTIECSRNGSMVDFLRKCPTVYILYVGHLALLPLAGCFIHHRALSA